MTYKPPPPPAGCSTAEDHERATTALADTLDQQIASLLEGGSSPMMVSRVKELALAICRLRKLASELALAREDREHSNWILGEYKKLHGHGRAERPRLKRRIP
jgi:hypothetical protein